MANTLYYNKDKRYEFDFRKKFVKQNGKRMDKFSIGYAVGHNGEFYKGLLIEQDAYSYEEAKQVLLNLLETKNFINVTVIK